MQAECSGNIDLYPQKPGVISVDESTASGATGDAYKLERRLTRNCAPSRIRLCRIAYAR